MCLSPLGCSLIFEDETKGEILRQVISWLLIREMLALNTN